MSTPRKPDLDHLIRALTADGRPDELAGRDAALASFRAASQRTAAEGAARRHRGNPFRLTVSSPLASGRWGRLSLLGRRSSAQAGARPSARGLTARLAVIAAVLVVAAGATAAAYTRTLPGPVQELAHNVFSPLGVPDGQQPGQLTPGAVPSAGSTSITIATSGGTPRPTAHRGTGGTPSPRPGDDYLITAAVSRTRVPAGGRVVLTGWVTDHGRAVARVRVRLFERLAGSAQFELVATGMTGPLGGFKLPSPPLTTAAVFRVIGPDGAHSAAVRVAVAAPRVTARPGAAPGQAATG